LAFGTRVAWTGIEALSMNTRIAQLSLVALILFGSARAGSAIGSEGPRYFLDDGALVSGEVVTPQWTLNFSCRLEQAEQTVDGTLTDATLWIESTLRTRSANSDRIAIELLVLDAEGDVLQTLDYREIENFSTRSLYDETTLAVPPETDSIMIKASPRGGQLGNRDSGRRFPWLPGVLREKRGGD
jgi:hypothetical protein